MIQSLKLINTLTNNNVDNINEENFENINEYKNLLKTNIRIILYLKLKRISYY